MWIESMEHLFFGILCTNIGFVYIENTERCCAQILKSSSNVWVVSLYKAATKCTESERARNK